MEGMTNRELADYCTAHWAPLRFLCEDCKYRNNICRVFRKKYGGDSPYMLHVRFPQIYTDEEIPNQEETPMKLRQVNMKATGERIQQLRKERGLTAKQITDALGLIPQTYYKWVWGRSVPSVDSLIGLADILEVMVDDIIVAE